MFHDLIFFFPRDVLHIPMSGGVGVEVGSVFGFSFHVKPRCDCSNQSHIHKTLMETVVRLKWGEPSWLTDKRWSS